MKIHLSLAMCIGLLGVATLEARAEGCGVSDFICQKFAKKPEAKASARRQATVSRKRSRPERQRAASVDKSAGKTAEPANAAIATQRPIKTSMIQASPPPVVLSPLKPGAISVAPKDLPNLVFGSEEQIEAATAQCVPVERSTQRILCQVAVHRLALTGSQGSGCAGTIGLRALEFTKNEEGAWVNEDSISLCGGRLLRRAEMVPVSVNGQSRYGFSEEYQLLGGDKACATPYLQSRYPLRKTYMPTGGSRASELNCGKVVAR